MSNSEIIFKYLSAESIEIDKSEFEFQFNSHPDFPSLLALSDTLNFFNITNGALKVVETEIELLPEKFIAALIIDTKSTFSFVEKTANGFRYTTDGKKRNVSFNEIRAIWDTIVLLVENTNPTLDKKPRVTENALSLLLVFALFVATVWISKPVLWVSAFYILPVMGVYLSILALKDLFNIKNNVLDKLCNTSALTSCSTVVNSSKWDFLNKLSFSDLSITFFTAQFVALFLMGLNDNYAEYFTIQKALLLLSIPIIVLSLHYQKFVEKKWCPICLAIIALLLAELVYAFSFERTTVLAIDGKSILLYVFVYGAIAVIWKNLKSGIKKLNGLKESVLKANRFKRNYPIFKNTLFAGKHYELPKSFLVLGNNNASLNISIITSPLCSYCKEPHYMLKSFVEKYGDKISVTMLFNIRSEHKNLKDFTSGLIELMQEKGKDAYYKAMDDWYKTKDMAQWLNKYKITATDMRTEQLLYNQRKWCENNHFNFTPMLFINGFRYPVAYDITDLEFFIIELIEETQFDYKELAETEKLLTE